MKIEREPDKIQECLTFLALLRGQEKSKLCDELSCRWSSLVQGIEEKAVRPIEKATGIFINSRDKVVFRGVVLQEVGNQGWGPNVEFIPVVENDGIVFAYQGKKAVGVGLGENEVTVCGQVHSRVGLGEMFEALSAIDLSSVIFLSRQLAGLPMMDFSQDSKKAREGFLSRELLEAFFSTQDQGLTVNQVRERIDFLGRFGKAVRNTVSRGVFLQK